MLLIILSIGAVYAFVPIIIIIILIIAAQGATGKDFFAIFGITTLTGWTSRIGAGGSGKGIKRGTRYKANTRATDKAAEAIGDTVIGHQSPEISPLIPGKTKSGKPTVKGFINKYVSRTRSATGATIYEYDSEVRKKVLFRDSAIRQSMLRRRKSLVNDMSPSQIKDMLKSYGKDTKNISDVAGAAIAELSLAQVSKYFYSNVSTPKGSKKKDSGNMQPLGAPQQSVSQSKMVRMSIGEFYPNYYKARSGKVKNYRMMIDKLRAMPTSDLEALCKANNVNVSPGANRNALLSAAYNGLTYAQLNSYIGQRRMGNVFRGSQEPTAQSGKAAPEVGGKPDTPDDSGAMSGMLNKMSTGEILAMCDKYGLKKPDTNNPEELKDFAMKNLKSAQISEFIRNILGRQPGT
ncbi:MAG: hypothetical protein ACREBH_02200 [Candidatus Micrarchaeaceae archaeon]